MFGSGKANSADPDLNLAQQRCWTLYESAIAAAAAGGWGADIPVAELATAGVGRGARPGGVWKTPCRASSVLQAGSKTS